MILDGKFDFILKDKDERIFALRIIGLYLDTLGDEMARIVRDENVPNLNFKTLTTRQKNALENFVGYGLYRKSQQAKTEIEELQKKDTVGTIFRPLYAGETHGR
jgi:hypothetical protein